MVGMIERNYPYPYLVLGKFNVFSDSDFLAIDPGICPPKREKKFMIDSINLSHYVGAPGDYSSSFPV